MIRRGRRHYVRGLALLALITATTALVTTCAPNMNLYGKVRALGTLRVAMINSATGYFLRSDGPAGFEYDLAARFAKNLGVHIQIVAVPNQRAAIRAIKSGQAHMAAGLTTRQIPGQDIRFTPPYSRVELDVVYNNDNDKPENLSAISGRLAVPADGALAGKLARRHPELDFQLAENASPETLLAAVAHGKLYSTIANDDLVAMNQRYYPNLRVAFTLPTIQRDIAWAFPQTGHQTLYNKAIAWLEQAGASGQIAILRKRYFAHAERLGFVGGRIFAEQIEQRLPQWRATFKRVANKYNLDWRLLAAMSYQESHWDPDAVSPTGVRGLMMLTEATAKELGIDNREDPEQSIKGGARYLIQQRKRLPESIKEPDRTWMALAAYNIGFGHLMDARRLLEARDKDADLWANVEQALTWLTKDKYTDETKYGYAPGLQAVEYVGNIRAYYDILLWKTGDKTGEPPSALTREPSPRSGEPQRVDGSPEITIDSPAL